MDLAINVTLGMVYKLMHEAVTKIVVSMPAICVNFRAMLYFVQHFSLERFALYVWDYLCTYLAKIAVKQSHYDGFALGRTIPVDVKSQPLGLVHILQLAADECFVYLDRAIVATKFESEVFALQGQSQAMQNEPSRLLCYPKCAVQLV